MTSGEGGERRNPLEAARRHSRRVRTKRFYKEAEVSAEDSGFALRLDGRRAVTPGRHPLLVPHAGLAEAVAAEWNAQGAEIDLASMPVTRLANSAIDGVAGRMEEVRAEIVAYAGTDLLYYRAGEPDGLVALQRAAWDPILAWAERRFGARLILAEGITHVTQSETALATIASELASFEDPFRLAGLHLATTLTGSALIALALAEAAIDADAAWAAAHVDEDWNISKWGEDADAAKARAARLADFRAAAMALGATK